MPQSGPSAASPPLRLSTTQADGSSVGKEQRHHENLNEERSRQDDAERIWKREQQRLKEREAIQDKFATLFEPPTPRASPTLLSSSLLPPSSATDLPLFNYRQTNSSRISRLSSNSSPEFGSFVKATDDPLSFPFTHEHLGQNEASFKNRPSPSHLPSNKTLQFFDSFTHDAKQRSSAARCQVLDELLLHEDDPMWFALGGKDGASQAEPLEAASIQAVSTHERNVSDEVEKRTSSKSLLLDIDHEYFRSSVPSSHVSSRSFSPTRHRTPSHSSSIPLPVVAPTIACQLTTSFPTGHYDPLVDHIKPLMPSAKEEVGSLSQALGCESSSSLSSKLMSSLLQGVHSSSDLSAKSNNTRSSSKISSHGANASGSIAETDLPVLNDNDSMPPRPFRVPSTFSMSPALEERGAHFSVLKQRSHFAPAVVTHSTSPFASSFYNSPSGAPGFEGDRYDWDKGFSDELDSERKGKSFVSAEVHDSNGSDGKGVSSRISGSRGSWGAGFGFGFGQVRPGKSTSHTPSPPSSVQDDELDSHARDLKTILPPAQNMRSDTPDWEDHDNGHKTLISSSSSTDVGSVGGMGEIIERMTGTIELVGRKASSDSVLMPELAYMVRSHELYDRIELTLIDTVTRTSPSVIPPSPFMDAYILT